MKVSLRPFEENDLISLRMWADEIEAQRFMSRVLPHKSDRYLYSQESLLAWYVIRVDDQNVGVVWLEKAAINDEIATLGILIGKNDLLGQGIGEKAINLAIKKSRDEMSFRSIHANVRESNTRAIRCYRKCGFVEILRGTKLVDGSIVIPFITMKLRLNQSSIHKV
jgi:RimJ/RimL family protein N-acetyltransferase